jgi:cytidylate kinase
MPLNAMNNKVSVITVDGPSGSGKGAISRWLAKELGWHYLDSGALYRVLSLAAEQVGLAVQDEAALADLASSLAVRFNDVTGDVYFKNVCVTQAIRSEACAARASKIAVLPRVRVVLLDKQRAFCKAPGLVADGRDGGTVVFPEAILKFFIEASVEERARRRYLQLKALGENVSLEALQQQLSERDKRDRARADAPLKPAQGAIVVDTTTLGVEAVCAHLKERVQSSSAGLLI